MPIIVTDNGSNMVKAFKNGKFNHLEPVIDSVVANKNFIDDNYEESDSNLYSDMKDVEFDFNVENEDHPDPVVQGIFLSPPISDDIDLDDDNITIEKENHQMEFLQIEMHTSQHLLAIFPRRDGQTEEQFLWILSCQSHKIQLVRSTFNKF